MTLPTHTAYTVPAVLHCGLSDEELARAIRACDTAAPGPELGPAEVDLLRMFGRIARETLSRRAVTRIVVASLGVAGAA